MTAGRRPRTANRWPRSQTPEFLIIILTSLGILLIGCATKAGKDEQPTPLPTIGPSLASDISATLMVTGHADGAPDGCTVETVAGRLSALASAFNNADPAVVPEFFGTDEPFFQWYCAIENGEPFTAYTLDELADHFQRRYAQNEKWQVQSVQVNGWSGGLLHFGPIIIQRTADDLPTPFASVGKGAYSCADEQFVVLCLGGEELQ